MKYDVDMREFACMVCMEQRWRDSKPRKGWICPYRVRNEYCPSLIYVYLREQDEKISWGQMGKDLDKNIKEIRESTEGVSRERTIHHLKLMPNFFDAVKQGTKTVEICLDDAKSKMIMEGDLIEFGCVNNEDKYVLVQVMKKTYFADFAEILDNYDLESLGFAEATSELICEYMSVSYDEQMMLACHAVAIEFIVLD